MPQRGIYSGDRARAPSRAGTRCARASGACRSQDLLAPAIYYAEEGFPVAEVTARGVGSRLECAALGGAERHATTFLLAARAPAAGEVFRNPDLAGVVAAIAEPTGATASTRADGRGDRRATARCAAAR